jgi:hypothetical protein
MWRHTLLATLLSLALPGCGDRGSSTSGERQAEAPKPAESPGEATANTDSGDGRSHADSGAVAGSHADWCEEHQVPESLCTRCNPTLVAAFKATGDWCAEHGLPESQCRQCNPDLRLERPAKRTGG